MMKVKQIDLRYEPCEPKVPGLLAGTIRTIPENYYVAHIMDDGHFSIAFSDIEVNTRDIKYKIAAIKFWAWTQGREKPDKVIGVYKMGKGYMDIPLIE
jgi:hypothetical protein